MTHNPAKHVPAIADMPPSYPRPTAEQVQRCEDDRFLFHCATGGDLPCSCGAHPGYQPPVIDDSDAR